MFHFFQKEKSARFRAGPHIIMDPPLTHVLFSFQNSARMEGWKEGEDTPLPREMKKRQKEEEEDTEIESPGHGEKERE